MRKPHDLLGKGREAMTGRIVAITLCVMSRYARARRAERDDNRDSRLQAATLLMISVVETPSTSGMMTT